MDILFISSIQDCQAEQWDLLFDNDYPFTRHAFLQALEESGCVQQSTGWCPQHVIVKENGTLVAAMPLYLKTHSYGEYVFDWAWANAYQQHGLSYYPKALCAIPFTPSTGPRIAFSHCIKENNHHPDILHSINHAIRNKFSTQGVSSYHLLFPEKGLSDQLKQNQCLQRVGIQYHWYNKSYTSFDDFLATFKSRKRKNVLKERNAVQKQGVSIHTVIGSKIDDELIEKFYAFYHLTYLKKSGQHGYLNLKFFQFILRNMADSLVMFCAYKDSSIIAAALCFKDDSTLYGRYWGCSEEYDFLHFETCYYQGIEFCIENGLQHFDPGAQGEHKIARGFEPIKTYSNHVIAHPEFSSAINHFIEEEKKATDAYINQLKNLLPYKT